MNNNSRFRELMRRATTRMRDEPMSSTTPSTTVNEEPDDDFVSSFSNFRTSRDTRPGRTVAAGAYRRKTNPLCSFKVICLEGPQQTSVNPLLIRRLKAKGLGTKKVIISRRSSVDLFKEKVKDQFPILKTTSVEFDLCIANSSNGNRLIPLRPASIRELKSLVPHSLYVRPKQNLESRSDDDENEQLYDPQLEANPNISNVASTPAHPETVTPTTTSGRAVQRRRGPIRQSEGDLPTLETPNRRDRPRRRSAVAANDFIVAVNSSEQENRVESVTTNQSAQTTRFHHAGTPTVMFRNPSQASNTPVGVSNETQRRVLMEITSDLTEDTEIQPLSDFIPRVAPFGDIGQSQSIGDLKNVLKDHQKHFINTNSEDPFLMEVRRGFVLSDALDLIRVSQDDLHNPLKISFCGEDGVDLGGLRREFWSIFLHQVTCSSFVKACGPFCHSGWTWTTYFLGCHYRRHHECLILNIDDLPDGLKTILLKMHDTSSESELRDLYCGILEEATDAGFVVPITSFRMEHRELLQAALIESQISTCQEELNQFIKGLETHQVLSLLKQDSNINNARCLLSGRTKPVTVTVLRSLLKFKYTEGNRKVDERATGQGFLTFLQATKGTATVVNGIKVDTKDVLMWLTGSTMIPAIGFHKQIDVEFGDDIFVNTCALSLRLKVQPNLSAADAVNYYTEIIINSQTFTQQ